MKGSELAAVKGVELETAKGSELADTRSSELAAMEGAELEAVKGSELAAVVSAELKAFPEEKLIQMLQQLRMHADMLQDLSGKSKKKKAKVLKGLASKATPMVQRYGTGEAVSFLAEVQLYLEC